MKQLQEALSLTLAQENHNAWLDYQSRIYDNTMKVLMKLINKDYGEVNGKGERVHRFMFNGHSFRVVVSANKKKELETTKIYVDSKLLVKSTCGGLRYGRPYNDPLPADDKFYHKDFMPDQAFYGYENLTLIYKPLKELIYKWAAEDGVRGAELFDSALDDNYYRAEWKWTDD